jgi:hypothetical protein
MTTFKAPLRMTAALLALSGCAGHIAPGDYRTYDGPESLLMEARDAVSIDLGRKDYGERLNDALSDTPPARAILNCPPAQADCKRARTLLSKHPIALTSRSEGSSVVLIYESLKAQDCDQRYVNNANNAGNLHYASRGCAISANMAQMISDKRQLTQPKLLDHLDGDKAAANYDSYANPPAPDTGSSSPGGSSGGLSSLLGSPSQSQGR